MVDFGELRVRLGLDSTALKAGLAQAKSDLTTWRDETNKGTADMARWGAAIGATVAPVLALGTAIYATQQKFGAMANEIDDLSITTGLSTDKIQQLQYAAVLSGDSFSSVTMGINQLTLSMSKASDATSEAGKAFAELGVSTAGKSPDQVFEDTTAALMGMEDTTKRNEIAMTLYGRSWKEMLPFMEDYIKNKEKIQKSPTFNKQELQDLKDAKAAWDDLGNSVTIYTGKALAAATKFNDDYNESQKRFQTGNPFYELFRDTGVDPGRGNGPKTGGADWSGGKKVSAGATAADPFAGLNYDQANTKYITDFQIPALEKKLKDLQASGTALPEEIAAASLDVISAYEKLNKATEAETDALRSQKDAVKDIIDETEKLADINTDYARNLQQLDPRDVQGFINLKMRYQWDKEDQGKRISAAESVAQAAGVSVSSGQGNITITGPITVTGDKSFEKIIQDARIRAGVRS